MFKITEVIPQWSLLPAEHHLKCFVLKTHIFYNFWKHMFLTIAILEFYFSNEKEPSCKKVNILEY